MKALGWNDRATADAPGFEPASGDMRIDGCSAQAGCLAGFANAESQLRGIGYVGLHWLTSLVVERGDQSWTRMAQQFAHMRDDVRLIMRLFLGAYRQASNAP